MSLILDALRKSEAERRRGQAPGLHVELAPAPRPAPSWAPKRWWPLLVLALALATALLLLAWQMRTPPSGTGVAVPYARSIPATVEPQPVVATTMPTPDMRSTQASDAPTARSAERSQSPASDVSTDVSTDAPALQASGPRLPPVRPASPPAATTTPTRTADAPVGMAAPPKPILPPAPPPVPSAPPIAATPATDMPATPTPRPVPSTAPAPVTSAPGTTEPTRLADLSAGERRQLPPLKISMHFWAPAQARRFAIIDGNRVGEGDRIGDAVVEAITADAVVIAWQGQRVRLPIR